MDSSVYKGWADNFVNETENLCSELNYILLVFDGFSSHIQLGVLQVFRDN